MGFADKLQKSADCMYTVYAPDKTGEDAWYIMKVEKMKEQIFLKEVTSGPVNLLDYGDILESGYGTKVPDVIKEKVKEEYNFTVQD